MLNNVPSSGLIPFQFAPYCHQVFREIVRSDLQSINIRRIYHPWQDNGWRMPVAPGWKEHGHLAGPPHLGNDAFWQRRRRRRIIFPSRQRRQPCAPSPSTLSLVQARRQLWREDVRLNRLRHSSVFGSLPR